MSVHVMCSQSGFRSPLARFFDDPHPPFDATSPADDQDFAQQCQRPRQDCGNGHSHGDDSDSDVSMVLKTVASATTNAERVASGAEDFRRGQVRRFLPSKPPDRSPSRRARPRPGQAGDAFEVPNSAAWPPFGAVSSCLQAEGQIPVAGENKTGTLVYQFRGG